MYLHPKWGSSGGLAASHGGRGFYCTLCPAHHLHLTFTTATDLLTSSGYSRCRVACTDTAWCSCQSYRHAMFTAELASYTSLQLTALYVQVSLQFYNKQPTAPLPLSQHTHHKQSSSSSSKGLDDSELMETIDDALQQSGSSQQTDGRCDWCSVWHFETTTRIPTIFPPSPFLIHNP